MCLVVVMRWSVRSVEVAMPTRLNAIELGVFGRCNEVVSEEC